MPIVSMIRSFFLAGSFLSLTLISCGGDAPNNNESEAEVPEVTAPKQQPNAQPKGQAVITDRVSEPMDGPKTLAENPDWKLKGDLKPPAVGGGDLFTFYASAYTGLPDRAKLAALKRDLDIRAASAPDGRTVPFEVFQKTYRAMKIQWKPLPPNEYYLYDPKTKVVTVYIDPTPADGEPDESEEK